MYAVKETNLVVSSKPTHYIKAHDFAHACEIARRERQEMEPYWKDGIDYTITIVDDLPDDFDFERQPDWN